MNNRFIFLLIGCCLSLFTTFAQSEFVENKGQWHQNVNYRVDLGGSHFFVEQQGYTVLLQDPKDLQKLNEFSHGTLAKGKTQFPESITIKSFAYKVKMVGAAKVKSIPEKPFNSYNNYFIGNDKSKWAADCKLYQAVTYKNIYPNIDIRYYSNSGNIKYDFIVHPGGDPQKILMYFDGPTSMKIDQKRLVIGTTVGEVVEMEPYSYQATENGRSTIQANYILKDNFLSFDVKKYDRTKTLVIDPAIVFATFTGSKTDNWGYTATPGPDGSFFAGGISFGINYPVSPGAYDMTFNGGPFEGTYTPGYDIAIMKFTPNGGNRVYATYLGGANGSEQPHSMIVDPAGNLVVAGRTNSPDYPTTNNRGGAGYDIVITKFNSTGTGIIGSLKIGGNGDDGVNIRPKNVGTAGTESLRRNYGDDARSEVILDAAGDIFLMSCTQSADFPIVNTSIQTTFGGGLQDGVILKLNPTLSTILFSTFFGGNGNDACFVGAIHPTNGLLYVGGATASSSIPGDKTGTIGTNFAGGDADGFVTIVQPNGTGIVKTTYLASNTANSADLVFGLKFDRLGFPYVMGTTTGSWPVLNATFSNPGSKQFISKLQPDLSAYIYSTVFGVASPNPNFSPVAFLVDRCQNVYVSGWGGNINADLGYGSSSTLNLPEVNPLTNIPPPDGSDFYFFVLEKNAASQFFGSHFGQNGGLADHVDGGTSRFDDNGVIYQAICGNCGGNNPSNPPMIAFPTTPGTWSPMNGSPFCNEIALKIDMNFAGVSGIVKTAIDGVPNDTLGCVPLRVDFKDTLLLAKKYYWNFGDGSPEVITFAPNNTTSHVYTTPGVYQVMLISEDSSTCNIRDTSYTKIYVKTNKVTLDFSPTKLQPCEALAFEFANTSTVVGGTFGPTSFVWDFGDGSAPVVAGFSPPVQHTFPSPGSYTIKLKLNDPQFCNYPVDTFKVINISPLVKAIFNVTTPGCTPYKAQFNNTSQAGTDWQWQFDNGTTFSTAQNPTYTFNTAGTYRVRLIAHDDGTCNKYDTSAYQTIIVYDPPTASFTWGPNPPQENVPVSFTNTSIGNNTNQWIFGDGSSSTEVNPTHEYDQTGNYNVLLIVKNSAGCPDTARATVSTRILPLLDVPNAFTPAQGTNNVIYVRGFGIAKMTWRIYNRWGEMVFESNNKHNGWNGFYKGKLQAMDVYAYTLDAVLVSGEKIRKTGDISLLR